MTRSCASRVNAAMCGVKMTFSIPAKARWMPAVPARARPGPTPAIFFSLKRAKQTFFVHDFAARQIQKERRRLHPAKTFVIEKMPCLRRQRHVAGNEIRLGEQRVQVQQFRVGFRHGHGVGADIIIVRENVHSQRARAQRGQKSDASQTDHAEIFAVKFRADKLLPFPAAAVACWFAAGIFRASASIIASVNSATEIEF